MLLWVKQSSHVILISHANGGADWRLAGLEMTGRHSGRVPFRLYAALETNNQVTWTAMDVTLVMSICVLYIESSEVIYIHLMMCFLLVVCIHWFLFHLLVWNELLVVELMSHWLYINKPYVHCILITLIGTNKFEIIRARGVYLKSTEWPSSASHV